MNQWSAFHAYCRHLLQAQPSRKGLQRRCPRCQGKFLEPTDPLPGVAPDALIQTEDEDGPEVEIEEPVSDQAVEPTVNTCLLYTSPSPRDCQ